MPTSLTFGGADKYYSADAMESMRSAHFGSSPLDQQIQELLENHDPQLRSKVERSFKQWNNIIRDYLRTETGLRLTVGDETQAVPVKIVAGLPEPLRQLLKDIPIEVLNLYLRRRQFSEGEQGVKLAQDNFNQLAISIDDSKYKPVQTSPDDLTRVSLFLNQAFQLINDWDLQKKIGQIEQDTLGAYFYLVPKIELYWMVIGLVARIIGVSVEALSAVIAIHELAHAYTHLGKDIDRQQWNTQRFASADLRIVEGLAQFYTAIICGKLSERFPDAKQAYEKLLEIQPAPYRVHNAWSDKPEDAGEVIRAAMIECRSKQTQSYEQFEALIDRHLDSIKGKKRKKEPDQTVVSGGGK